MNLGDMDKIKITSSEPKNYLVRSGKGFVTSLDFNTIRRSKNVKKAKFTITEVSFKDFPKIIE